MSPEQLLIPDIKLTHEEYLSLIYKIFTSSDGKLLLDIWTQQFLYKKIAMPGDIPLDIGIRQGEQQFVLSILNFIKQTKAKEIENYERNNTNN